MSMYALVSFIKLIQTTFSFRWSFSGLELNQEAIIKLFIRKTDSSLAPQQPHLSQQIVNKIVGMLKYARKIHIRNSSILRHRICINTAIPSTAGPRWDHAQMLMQSGLTINWCKSAEDQQQFSTSTISCLALPCLVLCLLQIFSCVISEKIIAWTSDRIGGLFALFHFHFKLFALTVRTNYSNR